MDSAFLWLQAGTLFIIDLYNEIILLCNAYIGRYRPHRHRDDDRIYILRDEIA